MGGGLQRRCEQTVSGRKLFMYREVLVKVGTIVSEAISILLLNIGTATASPVPTGGNNRRCIHVLLKLVFPETPR